MENLKETVQRMLDGEKKRREKAEAFLDQLTEILTEAGPDIWGPGVTTHEGFEYKAIWVNENIYFRYGIHRGDTEVEHPGFYYSTYLPVWGKPLESLKGGKFWNSIKIIIEWVNSLDEELKKKEDAREAILALLK
jgi:hypothetical protein